MSSRQRPIISVARRKNVGSREALEEFEQVYSAQANYPDVAMKIRVLRKTVEAR